MSILTNGTEVWLATTPVKDCRQIGKKHLKEIFYQLAEHDDNFNGNNNVEGESNYNWEATNEGGYASNCEYLTEEVLKDIQEDKVFSKYSDIHSTVEKFVVEWLKGDTYYKGVAVEVSWTLDTLIVAVGVTTKG